MSPALKFLQMFREDYETRLGGRVIRSIDCAQLSGPDPMADSVGADAQHFGQLIRG
jgi:hypothetical protein